MIKKIGLVKKRQDLTRQQFKEYWLNNHSKLEKESAQNNPVRRIVASFVVGENPAPFDGMVELYWDNEEDMKAQAAGGQGKIMAADEKNFCDQSAAPVFVVAEEYVMAEKSPRQYKEGGFKKVGFVKKRQGLTRQQFKEYWLNNHSKLEKESAQNNPVRRIVASFVVGEGPAPFDGMVELYWATEEEMKAQAAGPQGKIMAEDEKNFCDQSAAPVFVVTEEYVMAVKTPFRTAV
jgi:uncharacterized protein (TIGR02118 family)